MTRSRSLSAPVDISGTDYNKIVSEVSILLDDASAYEQMSKAINPYFTFIPNKVNKKLKTNRNKINFFVVLFIASPSFYILLYVL